MRKIGNTRFLAAMVGIAALTTGCGSGSSTPSASLGSELSGATFTVGSKDFTESIVLGQITMQVLKAHGATVVDKTNIKGSVTTRQAMSSGDISMYWEYTGTAWINYLKHTAPIPDSAQQFQAVKDEDLAKNKIVWLDPAPLNNTYAFAVRKDTADQLHVRTMSDIARLAQTDSSKATFCLESEFSTRDDGWPGVKKTYNINIPDSNVKMLDTGVIYSETGKGQTCTFGEVFTTDGRISSLKLTVMDDDKHFFPAYNAALTMPVDISSKYPKVAEIIAPITKKLTTEALQKINARVDVEGLTAAEAATEWLKAESVFK